jgi:hypothetical protein
VFRLAHTACICHRLCGRESVGFAADRSFSTAFEHCIHRSLSACNRFRFVIQLAIATHDLGLRLGSGLRFRAFSVSLSFDGRLSSASSTCFSGHILACALCVHLRLAISVIACIFVSLAVSSYQFRLWAGLRYGCLSPSITSVSLRAYSMLTARIGHSVFDCGSLISSLTLRLQFRYFLRMPAVRLRTLS